MIETYSDERRRLIRRVTVGVLLVGLLVLAIMLLIYLTPAAGADDLSCGGG
jgi:hypothetical protein